MNASFVARLEKPRGASRVDQVTGDVYVARDAASRRAISRFDSDRAPEELHRRPRRGHEQDPGQLRHRRQRPKRRSPSTAPAGSSTATSTSRSFGGTVNVYAGTGEATRHDQRLQLAVRRRRRPGQRRPLRRRLQLRRGLALAPTSRHDSGQRSQLHRNDEHPHAGHEPLPGRRRTPHGNVYASNWSQRTDEEVPGLRLRGRTRRAEDRSRGRSNSQRHVRRSRQPTTSTSTKETRSALRLDREPDRRRSATPKPSAATRAASRSTRRPGTSTRSTVASRRRVRARSRPLRTDRQPGRRARCPRLRRATATKTSRSRPTAATRCSARSVSLTGYSNQGHSELYRYDAPVGHARLPVLRADRCSRRRTTSG